MLAGKTSVITGAGKVESTWRSIGDYNLPESRTEWDFKWATEWKLGYMELYMGGIKGFGGYNRLYARL